MLLSFPSAATANYSLLEIDLPGRDPATIGVLLEDPAASVLRLRLRRDWESLADEDDREVLESLAEDLERKAEPGDLGAEGMLRYLEDTLSNALRITARESVAVHDYDRALNRLYREHVQSSVVPFRTHLPLYSLRAAAGKFLENDEVSEESWLETTEDLRLSPDMFVCRIQGHSMEPLIPDGSLCVFRHGVAGSRQNRLVLVENRDASGNNRYTVKRYRSEKARSGEAWTHTRIRLESLNPEYPSWDLDPEEDKYAILAEFIRVIE